MPAALNLTGTLNIPALQKTFTTLISRHESLRVSFPKIKGEATLLFNQADDSLEIIDLTHLKKPEQELSVKTCAHDHSSQIFNLNSGPLFKVSLLKLETKEHILLINMHHIIIITTP